MSKDFESFMYGYLDILITTGIISPESRPDCLEIYSACAEMFSNVTAEVTTNTVPSKDEYFNYLFDCANQIPVNNRMLVQAFLRKYGMK